MALAPRVELSREAEKTLDRLDQTLEWRIRQRLRELVEVAFDPRLFEALVGVEDLLSSRVGDWRILFTINETAQAVQVLAIRPRGQAYRNLQHAQVTTPVRTGWRLASPFAWPEWPASQANRRECAHEVNSSSNS